MELKRLDYELSVCKLSSLADANLASEFFFVGHTQDELSLVCLTKDAPPRTLAREDGWRAFVVQGVLDFSLVGILSAISSTLASAGIGIFAVSTYNTDYVLVKAENFAPASNALAAAGYTIV